MSAKTVGASLQRYETGSKGVELPASKELDDILNYLLEDAPSDASFRERTLRKAWGSKQHQFASPEGCVTTQGADSRTTLSWQTTNRGPTKSVTVSKETITRPTSAFQPETGNREWLTSLPVRSAEDYDIAPTAMGDRQRQEAGHQMHGARTRTLETHTKTMAVDRGGTTATTTKRSTSGERIGHPVITPPSTGRRVFKSPEFPSNGSGVRNELTSPPPSSSSALRQKRPPATVMHQRRQYASDSEEPLTWLEEQRRKLERKRAEGAWGRQTGTAPRTGFQRRVYAESDREEDMATAWSHGRPREAPLKVSLSTASLDNLHRRMPPSQALDTPRFTKEYGSPSTRSKRGEVLDRQYRDERYDYVASIQRPASATPHTKYSFTMVPAAGDFGSRAHLGASAPTSPLIPSRGESSREAVLRTQDKAKEWIGEYAKGQEKLNESERTWISNLRLTNPLKQDSDEFELITLHPIGRGVHDLEPRSEGIRNLTRSTPSLFQPQDLSGRTKEMRSQSTLGREYHLRKSPSAQRRNQSFSTLPAAITGRSTTSSIGQRTLTSLGPGVARGHDPSTAPQFVRRVQSNEALFKARLNAGPAGGYSVQGGVDGRHGNEQWSTSGQEESSRHLTEEWQEKRRQQQSQDKQRFQTHAWHQQEFRQQQQPMQQQHVQYAQQQQQKQQFEQQQRQEFEQQQRQQFEQQQRQQLEQQQRQFEQQQRQHLEQQRQQFEQQQKRQFEQQQRQFEQNLEQQQLQQKELQRQQLQQQQQFQEQQRQEQLRLQQPQQYLGESRTVTRTVTVGQNASTEGVTSAFQGQGQGQGSLLTDEQDLRDGSRDFQKQRTLRSTTTTTKQDAAVQAVEDFSSSAGPQPPPPPPSVAAAGTGGGGPHRLSHDGGITARSSFGHSTGANQLVEQVIERRILEREVIGGTQQQQQQQQQQQMGGLSRENQMLMQDMHGVVGSTAGRTVPPPQQQQQQQTLGQASDGQRVRVYQVESHSSGRRMTGNEVSDGLQQHGQTQQSDSMQTQRTFERSSTRFGTYSDHDQSGGTQYGTSYSQRTGYGTSQRQQQQQQLQCDGGHDLVDSFGGGKQSSQRWISGTQNVEKVAGGSMEMTEQQRQRQGHGYSYGVPLDDDGGGGGGGGWRRTGTMDGRAASAVPATDEGRWKISSANAEEEQEEEGAANERGGVGAVYGHRRGASFTDRRSVAHHLGHGRTVSASSVQDAGEWVNQPPRFVRDTSKFWHKPDLTRDEAINLLLDKEPGSFVVRNSNTFPGSFGLALKVSQVPPSMQTKGGDPKVDLIRHFLIEPTPKGVRLKGSTNEPVFASLTALIYQHSITPLSLPCKLRLPDRDISGSDDFDGAAHMSGLNSINQGPACTVLFLSSVGTENLTGPEALSRSIKDLFESGRSLPRSTIVQFKASKDGITLTDNRRRLFFRRFYPIETVTFCGSDPRDRRWSVQTEDVNTTGRAFGFVARKPGVTRENACHVFLELDPTQPADVIVNFVTKILIGQGQLPLQT